MDDTSPAVDDSKFLELIALSLLAPWRDTTLARIVKELAETSGASCTSNLEEPFVQRLGFAPHVAAARWSEARARASQVLQRGRAAGLTLLHWGSAGYPGLLRHIPDPPLLLWVKGDPASFAKPAVAVVGSRSASPAGIAVGRRLSQELAEAGLVVVSGMARGIDGVAHRGALDAGGTTVGVLGCGADVVYPPEHRDLVRQAAARGAIVSELPPGTPPRRHHFPLRNRIISGLSVAVVVVEASERSGSLITAKAALEQGREVLAVPGNVLSGRHRGSHALIKDGARLVETVEDVLDQIHWNAQGRPTGAKSTKSLPLSHLEVAMDAGEAYTLDELLARTSRPLSSILAELGTLELAGKVRRMAGGSFVRS